MRRLPMQGENVDIEQTKQMVDEFLAQGFNYFDTAHGYIGGKSELALKECLTSRYPREDYILTDKLTESFFKTEADIRPFLRASSRPAVSITLTSTSCTPRGRPTTSISRTAAPTRRRLR